MDLVLGRLPAIRTIVLSLCVLTSTVLVIVHEQGPARAADTAGASDSYDAYYLDVYHGRRISGSVDSLGSADNVSLDIRSKKSRNRQLVDYGLYVEVPTGSNPETIYVQYELDVGLTHQLWFWEWEEKAWYYLPKISVPANTLYYAGLLNDHKYISDYGELLVSFTATKNRAFTHALDQLYVVFDGKGPAPTPTPTPTPTRSADPGWNPAPQPQPVTGTTIRDLGVATTRCGEGGSTSGLTLTATAPRSAGWLIVGEVARLDLYAPPGSGGTIGWYLYDPNGGSLTVNGCSATYQAGTGGTFYQTSAEIILYIEGSQSVAASGTRSASRRLAAPAPPCSHLGCGTVPTPTPTPTSGGSEGGPTFGRTRAGYHKFLIYNPDNGPASLCDNEYLQVALPDFADRFFLDTWWGDRFGPFFKAATFQPILPGLYGIDIDYLNRTDEYVNTRVNRCGYARVIRG